MHSSVAPGQELVAVGGLDAGHPVGVVAKLLVGVDLGHAAGAAGDRDVAREADRGPRRAAGAVGPNDEAADLGDGLGVDLGDGALGAVGRPQVGELEVVLDARGPAVLGRVGDRTNVELGVVAGRRGGRGRRRIAVAIARGRIAVTVAGGVVRRAGGRGVVRRARGGAGLGAGAGGVTGLAGGRNPARRRTIGGPIVATGNREREHGCAHEDQCMLVRAGHYGVIVLPTHRF